MTASSSSDQAMEESREAMGELMTLITELTEHTQRLRSELAVLSFMTMVQASNANSEPRAVRNLGGEAGVRTAVVMLYERVMADPVLSPFFSGVDMTRIRQRQVEMFLALFGVRDYRGKSLRIVHEPLRITQAAFDRLMGHIATVLRQLGLTDDEVAAFIEDLRPFEKEIVTA